MAVETTSETHGANQASGGGFGVRHLLIGTNVLLSVVAATAIVAVLQWGAFFKTTKFDLTDQGINSLTAGTERLVKGLPGKVRLTSAYFQTDLEDEDQAKYRGKIGDLINLYQSANRSLVEVDSFNPLQDHSKRERLMERLQNLEKFKSQTAPYREVVERFQKDLSKTIGDLLQREITDVSALVELAPEAEKDLLQVQDVLNRWQEQLNFALQDVTDAMSTSQPRLGTASGAVSTLCSSLSRDLNAIVKFGGQLLSKHPDSSKGVRDFFAGAETRYQTLIGDLDGEATKARELPPLDFENIARQVGATSNALVVETEADAKVIGFAEVWPTLDPNLPPTSAKFANRLFKGEEKVTSALLQLTEKQKTAVVFVRFGGGPLFFGGMPGQPPADYADLKQLLEDANFQVEEWDVGTSMTPPEMEPAPSRTLWVVLRPENPPPNFQQQMQQPKNFDDTHRQAVLAAMGDNARAIFIAGWAPGPFGAFPEPYPYETYLNDQWGVHVSSDRLLLEALVGQRPGEFTLQQRSLFISDFERSDHLLVKDLRGQSTAMPYACPLDLAAQPPEGVTLAKLLTCARTDTLWGVKDLQKYSEKTRVGEPVTKSPEDVYGPFTLAAVAEKGEAKIVVLSSRECMTDQVAMAPALMRTSQGLTLRPASPGNVALFLNSLHWLNDRTEWMGVGRPVDAGSIQIEEGRQLTTVRVMVGAVWPALVACCGLVAWWVRRR